MIGKKALILCILLLGIVVAQEDCVQSDPHLLNYMRNGLTFQVQITPKIQNNWVGKFSCQGCNPAQGDIPCTTSLPLLCILHAKGFLRPFYAYSPLTGPYQNPDAGYYNGWTGGIFQTTQAVRGYDITSYKHGDKLCKDYFGIDAKWATFHDGFYLPNMNDAPQKTWKWWTWATANQGAWGYWGYLNTNYRGRAWIHIANQETGNCADL